MKNYFTWLTAFMLMYLTSCTAPDAVERAVKQVADGSAQCVLVSDGKIVAEYSGRGLSPLLEVYYAHGAEMRNGIIVDKVIGRAAAFVAAAGGADAVYAEVMSGSAAALLDSFGIENSCRTLVPEILNRSGDDLCPLEKAVAGANDPAEALILLEKKIAEMQKKGD